MSFITARGRDDLRSHQIQIESYQHFWDSSNFLHAFLTGRQIMHQFHFTVNRKWKSFHWKQCRTVKNGLLMSNFRVPHKVHIAMFTPLWDLQKNKQTCVEILGRIMWCLIEWIVSFGCNCGLLFKHTLLSETIIITFSQFERKWKKHSLRCAFKDGKWRCSQIPICCWLPVNKVRTNPCYYSP